MTQTFQEMASDIIKNRQKQKEKHNKDRTEKIKADFIKFVLRGYFTNIIDLIIEYHDLVVDTTDQEFVLEELLKLENVTVRCVNNIANAEERIITFNNIFGLKIQFVSNAELRHLFYCTITKNEVLVRDVATDIDRITLATYVADYLQEQD